MMLKVYRDPKIQKPAINLDVFNRDAPTCFSYLVATAPRLSVYIHHKTHTGTPTLYYHEEDHYGARPHLFTELRECIFLGREEDYYITF